MSMHIDSKGGYPVYTDLSVNSGQGKIESSPKELLFNPETKGPVLDREIHSFDDLKNALDELPFSPQAKLMLNLLISDLKVQFGNILFSELFDASKSEEAEEPEQVEVQEESVHQEQEPAESPEVNTQGEFSSEFYTFQEQEPRRRTYAQAPPPQQQSAAPEPEAKAAPEPEPQASSSADPAPAPPPHEAIMARYGLQNTKFDSILDTISTVSNKKAFLTFHPDKYESNKAMLLESYGITSRAECEGIMQMINERLQNM